MDKAPAKHAQRLAHRLIQEWVKTEKTPMPKKELFKALVLADVSESTARKSIAALVTQGFIRRADVISNQTFYVLIRTASAYEGAELD